MEELKRYTGHVKAVKADEGIVEGVFATLNTIDLDGDVTLPGAFGDQKVKIAAWGHDWGSLPPGRGTIAESGTDAVFASQFNLDTTTGKEHFATIKFLDELQEWSYGFEVREAVTRGSPGFDDLLAQVGMEENSGVQRFLLKLNVFEVSPVMRGAGIGTHTTIAKNANEPYADQIEAALAAVSGVVERSKSLADLRAKEGRTLSQANREKLQSLMERAREVAKEIEALLAATDPEKGHAILLGIMRERFYKERAA